MKELVVWNFGVFFDKVGDDFSRGIRRKDTDRVGLALNREKCWQP